MQLPGAGDLAARRLIPRTLAQTHALAGVLWGAGRHLTAAVFIDAPDATVIERIAGRADGRDDDDIATVRRRLEQFHRSTAPVIEHYEQTGLLYHIDASRPIADVYADARALLVSLAGAPRRPWRNSSTRASADGSSVV